MFREVLRKVCAVELGHEVVGEADNGERAIELICRVTPELVLLDLHLPGLDGFAVAEEIRRRAPLVKILVLSSHCDEYAVFRAEQLRVQGFVDKNTNSVETLKQAIRAVAEGRPWFSELFQRAKAARRRDPLSFDKILTERERAILVLIGVPLSDAEIAQEIGIAEDTAAKHRFNLLRKLELQTTTELVRYAREHGFTLPGRPGSGPESLP
ncbi:MAG: response regulator transcription factor [Opitutaceae bacterium]|nr:response regulator transcription factor [Opitutaceae bacterium]